MKQSDMITLGVAALVGFIAYEKFGKPQPNPAPATATPLQPSQQSTVSLLHPFGQSFDDWINNLIGGPTSTTSPQPVQPDFGINDPTGNWS
jgi:hypothetical protein